MNVAMICFGIAVPLFPADIHMLRVFFQAFDGSRQLIVQPQGRALAVAAAPDRFFRLQGHELRVFPQNTFQILNRVRFPYPKLYSLQFDPGATHLLQKPAYFQEHLLPVRLAALLPHSRIPVGVCRDLCPVDVNMFQIHCLFFKNVPVDFQKNLLAFSVGWVYSILLIGFSW